MRATSRWMIVLLAVVLSACSTASGPKFRPPAEFATDKATIYLLRGGGVIGADRSYSIFANKEYIGTFAQYSYTMFETEETNVSFAWTWQSRNYGLRFAAMLSGVDIDEALQGTTLLLSLDVEPGKVYFVKLTPTTNNAWASLKLIDPDEGAKEISAYSLWADRWTDELTRANGALGKQRYDEAEMRYQAALLVVDKAPSRCAEAITLNYLGITYFNQNRNDEANAHFERSIAAWEQCGDKRGLAISLTNYAELLRSQGRDDDAAAIETRLEDLK